MGSTRIFSLILLSCFLLLFLSPGFGAEVVMGTGEHVTPVKESVGKSRKMMIEVADYRDPGPNRPTMMRSTTMIPHPSPPPPKL